MIETMICMATSDFQWQLYPFVHFLHKYWGRAIHIVYYTDRLNGDAPPCVEVKPVPLMQERGSTQWDWSKDFGDGISSILRDRTEPVVAVSIMDYWLVGPADLGKVDKMARYMEEHSNIVYSALGPVPVIPQEWVVERWEGMDVLTCSPHDNFNGGIMMNCGLFNRELTLSLYRNTSSLESETMGWKVMQEHPEFMSVWTRPTMYPRAHISRNAAPDYAFLSLIPEKTDRAVARSFLPGHLRED